MVALTPNGRHVFVGHDVRRARLGEPGRLGDSKSIASNAPDPDGIAVFPVQADGSLGAAKFHDGNAGSPFFIAFLNHRRDMFVTGAAVGDRCVLGTIDEDGDVEIRTAGQDRYERGPSDEAVLTVRLAGRPVRLRHELRLQLRQRLQAQRQRPRDRLPPRVSQGQRQRQLPRAQQRRHQRPKRQLDLARRRLPVPDLCERLEAGRIPDSAARRGRRSHQRDDPLQQPAGPRGLLDSDGGGTRSSAPRRNPFSTCRRGL
jgi:hypothetical protein